MARIRTIKPEFWTDGDVMDLSAYARLLFIGCWNFALCDNGHVADDPRRLKMQILPSDDVDGAALVDEIVASGRMARITVGDRTFLHVVRFTEHQKTEKRWSPRCPACQALDTSTPDHPEPRSTSPNLSETPRTSDSEGKGGEGIGGESEDADASSPREPDKPAAASQALALVESAEDRPEVDRLCELLADEIVANGGSRPTIGKRWRDAARLMLDRDGRTEEQVATAIRWAQADEFWRSNILSMPKLREQYERLRLAAQRSRAPTRQEARDEMFARALARAQDRERATQ